MKKSRPTSGEQIGVQRQITDITNEPKGLQMLNEILELILTEMYKLIMHSIHQEIICRLLFFFYV